MHLLYLRGLSYRVIHIAGRCAADRVGRINFIVMIYQIQIVGILDRLRADEKKAIRELWKANQGAWPEMITHWTAKRNAYRKYRKILENLNKPINKQL